jgi:lipopolysaccharide transport system ATP-binding protein
MTELAISVKNISKRYRLGEAQGSSYQTLRESLMRAFSPKVRRPNGDSVLQALRDVSFDVAEGEVVGIIGRNGAGKSTLLKVLSRITEPTSGYANVHGRIGSLLEVGSGFHPELSGRENILLNGAILGMRRSEILAKFDQIVAFAEVERFIDTPVKRYSSGMYLRLAFAVAAHLEPEILVVDEVLAVGDFDFQNKCLGKMKDVAGSGRTVLFVSHNMGAVQHLCERVILLNQGTVLQDGPALATISQYLAMGLARSGERVWERLEEAPGFEGVVKLHAIRALGPEGAVRSVFDVTEPITIEVEYIVLHDRYSLNVHLYFQNDSGQTIFVAMDNLDSPWKDSVHPRGHVKGRCHVPANFLNEGNIRVEYLICTRPTTQHYVTVPDALSFHVTDDRKPEGVRGNWTRDWPQAAVRPRTEWHFETVSTGLELTTAG